MEGTGWAEDGFAIAALGFASCPAFAGVTGLFARVAIVGGGTRKSPRGLRGHPTGC